VVGLGRALWPVSFVSVCVAVHSLSCVCLCRIGSFSREMSTPITPRPAEQGAGAAAGSTGGACVLIWCLVGSRAMRTLTSCTELSLCNRCHTLRKP
jgi:hypothetical protein